MKLNIGEMTAIATKASKDRLPTWKNEQRAKAKRAKAKIAPKRKRRKTAKARLNAKVQKIMEAPHRKDLSGQPIITYAQKPVNSLCLKCKKECKQTMDVILVLCPFYDAIVPRKNASQSEE